MSCEGDRKTAGEIEYEGKVIFPSMKMIKRSPGRRNGKEEKAEKLYEQSLKNSEWSSNDIADRQINR